MNLYKENFKISSNKLIGILLFLAIFFKEFYIFKSGVVQLGDIFYLISFFIIIFNIHSIKIIGYDIYLIIFICLSIIINLVYSILYNTVDFFIYSSYMIYSLMIIFIVRYIYNKDTILKYILFSSKLVIVVQLIIAISGKGEYYFDRYIGSFNDPNQFAYYIFSMLLLIFIIKEILREKHKPIWAILTMYLIYLSKSASMTIGIMLFFIIYFIFNIFSKINITSIKKLFKVFTIALIFIIFIRVIKPEFFNHNDMDSRIISRISQSDGLKSLVLSFIDDRGMNRIIEKPLVFLYGSGEGMWSRYKQGFEMHSTILGLMYYYGIIPFMFFTKWIYKNFSKMDRKLYCAYISFIFIAFTLINHRQPTFWLIIVLASNPRLKKNTEGVIE